MNTLLSNSTSIQHATRQQTADSRQQTADSRQQSLIDDRTIMNVLSKNLITFQRIAFVLLFVLSNLLFFQPTHAQLDNPYSGYACGDTTECPWTNDSLSFPTPGDPTCNSTLYFKRRVCNGELELQPTAVSNYGCSMIFYGDTNSTDRMEQLLKLGERLLVNKEFTDFYNALDTNTQKTYWAYFVFTSPTDSTLTSISKFKIIFQRPQCRGVCIQYNRPNPWSAITSSYAKWYNCGNACCKVTSEFALDTFAIDTSFYMPPEYYRQRFYIGEKERNIIRTEFNVETTGECDTITQEQCPSTTLPNRVFKQRECRDYCLPEHTNGIDAFGLSSFEKKKNGVVNMDEMPYFTDKHIQTLPIDAILESTSKEIIVDVSGELSTVRIVSLDGTTLMKLETIKGSRFQVLPTNNLQNGLYLLVIETKTGITTKPVIIAK